jgi:hypothetical protein
VEVLEYQPDSLSEVQEVLAQTGFSRALMFPGEVPRRLSMWMSSGHWHVRMEYARSGKDATVIQAGGAEDSLTTGKSVSVRGHHGVRQGQRFYWKESGFVLTLSPANLRLAEELMWTLV